MSASASDPSDNRGVAGESYTMPEPSSLTADDSHSDDDPVANYRHDNAILSNDPLGDLGNGFVAPFATISLSH